MSDQYIDPAEQERLDAIKAQQAEPVTKHLGAMTKANSTTFYSDRRGAIDEALKKLGLPLKTYRLRDFYKAKHVAPALALLEGNTEIPKGAYDKDGKPTLDSPAEIITKLQANPDKVIEYYESQLDSYLTEQTKLRLTPEQRVSLDKFIELTDGIYTEAGSKKTRVQGYTIPSDNALRDAIKGLKPVQVKAYDITTQTDKGIGNSLEASLNNLRTITDLAEACVIKTNSQQQAGGITVTTALLDLANILSVTLAKIAHTTKAKPVDDGAGREAVNILNSEQHRFIARPSTIGLFDMITKAVEGKDLVDLKDQYLDNSSRKDDGGFLTHIDDPQTALPLAFEGTDITALQQAKLVANSVALTIQAVGALQAYKRDNPDTTGYIKIKDLAKYIKRYNDDMAVKGSLRPQYRQAILNGLMLAGLAGNSYIISKDKKTGKTKHGVLYLIDRISEYETNKKGDIIAVVTNFTSGYKASLQYNPGVLTDGVERLKTTEAINLATYISDRQVAKQNDTVAGKPIICKADTLCIKAGITDQTITNRHNTLTKLLDELVAEGIAIGRWDTEAGGKNITGYNPKSQKLYIYPHKTPQTAYTTKERTKAVRDSHKLEQANRVKALKRYAKGYTDLNVLANEMGVTRPELDNLVAGNTPITEQHQAKIDLDTVVD